MKTLKFSENKNSLDKEEFKENKKAGQQHSQLEISPIQELEEVEMLLVSGGTARPTTEPADLQSVSPSGKPVY